MTCPAKVAECGWFGAGYAVFGTATADRAFYPPLDDDEAQRQWLAGFGAAWVECPDDAAIESILDGDWLGGESVEEALVRIVGDQRELLRQLWAHGLSTVARVIH